jgi:Protein of unknown function (DUF4232)
MKLTARTGRRLAAGIALASTAIVLPSAALAASGTAAHPAAAAPACRHASTQVWLGLPGDGSAGTIVYQLEFSNVGRHTCTLFGYPGVSALNGSGQQVGRPASHSGVRHLVTLRPGGTAHAVLTVHEAGAFCPHPLNGATLQVFPAGQTRSQEVDLAVQVCAHRRTMNVQPIGRRAGIPFFTNS